MSEPFLRQSEAWDFTRAISEPKARLLTELALGKALVFLAADSQFAGEFQAYPLDALHYARCLHAFFSGSRQVVEKVLGGEITSVDDLNPFPW